MHGEITYLQPVWRHQLVFACPVVEMRLFVLEAVRHAEPLSECAWALREWSLLKYAETDRAFPQHQQGEERKATDLLGCVLTLHGNLCQTWRKPSLMTSSCSVAAAPGSVQDKLKSSAVSSLSHWTHVTQRYLLNRCSEGGKTNSSREDKA